MFMFNGDVKTPCVEAVIVARNDLDEDLLEQTADVLLNMKTTLLNVN